MTIAKDIWDVPMIVFRFLFFIFLVEVDLTKMKKGVSLYPLRHPPFPLPPPPHPASRTTLDVAASPTLSLFLSSLRFIHPSVHFRGEAELFFSRGRRGRALSQCRSSRSDLFTGDRRGATRMDERSSFFFELLPKRFFFFFSVAFTLPSSWLDRPGRWAVLC